MKILLLLLLLLLTIGGCHLFLLATAHRNENSVQPLAQFAVKEYNKQKHGRLSLSGVVSWAERAAPNNVINYYITLQAMDGKRGRQYLAIVGIRTDGHGRPVLQSFQPA